MRSVWDVCEVKAQADTHFFKDKAIPMRTAQEYSPTSLADGSPAAPPSPIDDRTDDEIIVCEDSSASTRSSCPTVLVTHEVFRFLKILTEFCVNF